jgi:hypothetical protein
MESTLQAIVGSHDRQLLGHDDEGPDGHDAAPEPSQRPNPGSAAGDEYLGRDDAPSGGDDLMPATGNGAQADNRRVL